MKGTQPMKVIQVYLPVRYIRELDQLVANKKYPNRAEAIRTAIRDLLRDEVWKKEA